MQRGVSRHTALKINQVLLVGLQPASSAESPCAYSWRGLGLSRNCALQTMDFSVRPLVGSNARALGSLPGRHHGGRGSSFLRISSSTVPRVRPAITRPAFRESRRLVNWRSRQQRSTSSRIGSTGDFSPQRLLESVVDVLRKFNEKVNNLFQQGGDSGSRDFTTAGEEKDLTSAENGFREDKGAPELVGVASEQEHGSEFEWRTALWEAEVSSVGELETVAQREGMISSEGTDRDVSQEVTGCNVPEVKMPAAISPSPELGSSEDSNVISAVPIRPAESSLETEEREILSMEKESNAESRSGLMSSLGTDGHTSSQLSGGMIISEGTNGDVSQQVSGSNVPEEKKPAAISPSPELESPEDSNANSAVPVRGAESSVETEEREILSMEKESNAESRSSLGTDGHTSSQFSGGIIISEGTNGDVSQQVRGSNVLEEKKPAAISQSPELESPEGSDAISAVPVRGAESCLETEEREILSMEKESNAESRSGLMSSSGTDGHTSSQLSGGMIISEGTNGDSQQVSGSNVPEEKKPAAISPSPELESPEDSNAISAVSVRGAESSLETEEREILSMEKESNAESRSGLMTSSGTNGHTSSQLSGGMIISEGTNGGSQQVSGSNVPEEKKPAAISPSPELESPEDSNAISAVPVRGAESSVETEEREILSMEKESNAESRSGLMSSSGTDGHTSSQLTGGIRSSNGANGYVAQQVSGSNVPEEKTPEAISPSPELESLEDGNVISAVPVRGAEFSIETDERGILSMEKESNAESRSGLVSSLGSDGHTSSQLSVFDVPESTSLGEGRGVEIRANDNIAEAALTEEANIANRALDHPDHANAQQEVPSGEVEETEVWSVVFHGDVTDLGTDGDISQSGGSAVKEVAEEFGEPFREEQGADDAKVAIDSASTDRNMRGTDNLALQLEISRLRNSISHHAYQYHTLDSPVLSDAAYDSLVNELVNLEAQVSNSESSSTVPVAAQPSPDMLKVYHSVPMLSLASVQKEEDVLLWYRKLQQKLGLDQITSGWVVEPKVDGLALSLVYEHGILKRAATRGNGIQGEDVTHNAQRVLGIPLTIPQKLPGTESSLTVLEVRGEIYMSLKDFKELNASKIQAGDKPFANPRNAAAGSMRLLSSNSNDLRPLSFMAYSIAAIEVRPEPTEEDSQKSSLVPANQWEVLQLLESTGFAVNEDNRFFESFESGLEYTKSWRSMRKNLQYEADGVVLKVNDLGTQASLGSTGADPRWALAWKFAATEAVSVLEGIELTIGRSGAMIPNARLKPVELGGAVISRASLHNFGHVKALGLCEGDRVVVHRAGDVIPQVVQVLDDLRPETATPWVPPQECPTCGSTLTEASASTMVFCSNNTCPSRHSRQVGHFAKTLISGLGLATLSRLEEELVNDPADFYDLDEKALSKVKGFGKQSIKKLLKAIEESKQQDLWLFIAALGIPKVGTNTAKELAKKFGSLRALLESDVSGFMEVPGIGAATASCIFDWCQAKSNIEIVQRLREAGCRVNGDEVTETLGNADNEENGSITESEGETAAVEQNLQEDTKTTVSAGESDLVADLEDVVESDDLRKTPGDLQNNVDLVEDVTVQPTTPPLSGKSVVITGDFGTLKREDMKNLVTLHGGAVRTTVTSRTSFVLLGNRPGSLKLAEASRRGVEMVDLQGFLNLIGKTQSDIS